MTLELTFHGAAECVTGFCARLRSREAVILVDCGMFQGPKSLKALNYQPFPFDVDKIDAVLLTHAHLDHSGLLPKLMRAGYSGPIYATSPTRDLCEIMLADAGGLQESEVRRLNRRNAQRGRPQVTPIYEAADAGPTLDLFRPVELNTPLQVAPGLTATYWEAGHILGAASIELVVETEADGPVRLLFSGDLGPGGRDFVPDPQAPADIDHLIVESTYGDRDRRDLDPEGRRQALAQELRDAHAAGGPLLIPAFAIERAQELLADMLTLMDAGDVPAADIFLDSPLAIRACEIFAAHGRSRGLAHNPFDEVRPSSRLKFVEDPHDSDNLGRLTGWHIVMAGSGMCDGGRIRGHLKRWLWNRRATVLLAGFQAAGTLGRILADGAPQVSIQGEELRVGARIRVLDIYSGHADAGGLVSWVLGRRPIGGSVFLVHGEPESSQALRRRLTEAGLPEARLVIPGLDATYNLGKDWTKGRAAKRRLETPPTRLDWHNARARLLLDLDARLEAEPSDEAREALLAALMKRLN